MDGNRDISEDLPLGGFAAAIGGYARKPLDLNELLVRNPPATFFARMAGDDMLGMNIGDGDILVVDRSANPKDGDIVIFYLESEFLARRIRRENHSRIRRREGREKDGFSARKYRYLRRGDSQHKEV